MIVKPGTPGETGVVLASGSKIRRQLLDNAGISCRVAPAVVDEASIRSQLFADHAKPAPSAVAEVLAHAKALKVSRLFPSALVIGADQILSLPYNAAAGAADFDLIHKAGTLEQARATLMRLRGTTHELHVSVAIAERGEVTWSASDVARLKMRRFSAEFLDQYLARAGGALYDSVGAYHLEGLGLQLFEQTDGNYFTILGLPMLPLLAELRQRRIGVV
jgi:septum formation protein